MADGGADTRGTFTATLLNEYSFCLPNAYPSDQQIDVILALHQRSCFYGRLTSSQKSTHDQHAENWPWGTNAYRYISNVVVHQRLRTQPRRENTEIWRARGLRWLLCFVFSYIWNLEKKRKRNDNKHIFVEGWQLEKIKDNEGICQGSLWCYENMIKMVYTCIQVLRYYSVKFVFP